MWKLTHGKKTHERLLCGWAHCMTGQGQVTGVQVSLTAENETQAERVVWTPSNLKCLVCKYFGFWSVDGKNADPYKVVCKLQLAYHSTTSNMRHISKMCIQMSMPWCLELQLDSHVSTHIFHHPPQALCLQHDKRHAWRNLLCSYARTWGWSVSTARASESFVKNLNRGTASEPWISHQLNRISIWQHLRQYKGVTQRTSFRSSFDSPALCPTV